MPARTEIRVRYAETDKMGVVYHSNYFVWMEIGRTELFRKMGLPYKVIEEKGIIFPVVEAFCRYKKSALYDDEIVIETVLKHYSAAKVVLDYKIIREKDEVLLAEGETVHGIVTTEGKPVSIKKLPWLQEKFDKIMEIRGN